MEILAILCFFFQLNYFTHLLKSFHFRRVLVGHRAAVNVVDFDDKYIVSASGDRTIKVPCIPEYRSVLTSVHIFDKYGHPSISLFFQVRFFQQLSLVCYAGFVRSSPHSRTSRAG